MKRRVSGFVGLVLLTIATTSLIAASIPSITGRISGVELCPQSVCGEAVFSGSFSGRVDHAPTYGVFWVGATWSGDLSTTVGGTTDITGGTWMINTQEGIFSGTIENGGVLTYIGHNKYDVNLTMDVASGGTGTLTFDGVLDHNPFPPTITGKITQ